MNRRNFLQFTLAASTLALLPGCTTALSKAAPRHPHPKRGLGLSTRVDRNPLWREKLAAINLAWFYSWGPEKPEGLPPGVEFVPMVFRKTTDERFAEITKSIKDQKSTHVLGLNEPDEKKQGNMSVEEALDFWPKLMELGLPLGSPGCVHPDNAWMKAFMKGADERGLRVDFVNVHSYAGPGVDSLMRRLETIRDLYGRPLWITEFAVGDWQAKSVEENRFKPERIQAFMRELLPRLDSCEFVERYAWFPARPTSIPLGTSALFNEDASLTPLGEIYRSA
jgi:hypothetical protein